MAAVTIYRLSTSRVIFLLRLAPRPLIVSGEMGGSNLRYVPAIFAASCLLAACHQPTPDNSNVQSGLNNNAGTVANTSVKAAEPIPTPTPASANVADPDLPATGGKSSDAKAADPDQTTIEGGTIERTVLVGGKRIDLLSNANSPDAGVGSTDYLLLINNEPAVHETGTVSMKIIGPYILLQIDSGGSSCPATYEIVDPSGIQPKVTETFGSCSDLAKSRLATDGGLIVKTPRFGSAKASVAHYSQGMLTTWE